MNFLTPLLAQLYLAGGALASLKSPRMSPLSAACLSPFQRALLKQAICAPVAAVCDVLRVKSTSVPQNGSTRLSARHRESRAAAVSRLRRFSPCHRLYHEQFYHARRASSQNFSLRRSMLPPKKQAPRWGAPPKKVPSRSPELFEFLGFGMKSQQGI